VDSVRSYFRELLFINKHKPLENSNSLVNGQAHGMRFIAHLRNEVYVYICEGHIGDRYAFQEDVLNEPVHINLPLGPENEHFRLLALLSITGLF
jgi:hypothetical protein